MNVTAATGDDAPLTRQELYDLVWSEPMRALAPRFGLSDVALAKICAKHRIPRPYRGYWARKEAGKPVIQARLRPLPETLKDELGTIRLASRSVPEPREEPTGPVADQARYEALPENRIVILDEAGTPHPLVERTGRTLRNARKDERGHLIPRAKRHLDVTVTPGTLDRALRIMNALVRALEARGLAVTISQDEPPRTFATVLDEQIGFALEERVRAIEKTVEPPKRRTTGRLWQPVPTYSWTPKQYEYVATGELSLRITTEDARAVRQSWRDGKKQRVEGCLNKFIVGLVAAAVAVKEARRQREEWQRNWEEQQRQRIEREKREQEERKRIEELEKQVLRWEMATRVREYVVTLRTAAEANGPIEPNSPLASWLEWAQAYGERLDPFRDVNALAFVPRLDTWMLGASAWQL